MLLDDSEHREGLADTGHTVCTLSTHLVGAGPHRILISCCVVKLPQRSGGGCDLDGEGARVKLWLRDELVQALGYGLEGIV